MTPQEMVALLQSQALARPDLGQEQPVSTYLGRVVKPGETVQDVVSRPATHELESGATVSELMKTLAPSAAAFAARRMVQTPKLMRHVNKVEMPDEFGRMILEEAKAYPGINQQTYFLNAISPYLGKAGSAVRSWADDLGGGIIDFLERDKWRKVQQQMSKEGVK
jgi:hypothetical protein